VLECNGWHKKVPATGPRVQGRGPSEWGFREQTESYHTAVAVSIKVSTYVWEYSEHKGTALLLMLAIADHAHDDGGGAYPSIATLARKARTSERNVKLLLPKLEGSGELEVKRGAGPHGTNLYRVRGVKNFHPRFYDGSNDGLGEAQFTPNAHQISPPHAREFTVPPERDLGAYLGRERS
jgi:Helix-turn-helix domain